MKRVGVIQSIVANDDLTSMWGERAIDVTLTFTIAESQYHMLESLAWPRDRSIATQLAIAAILGVYVIGEVVKGASLYLHDPDGDCREVMVKS